MSGWIKWGAVAALSAVGLGAVYVSTVGLGGTQAAATQYLTQAAQLTTVARTSAATGTVAAADSFALSFGATPQVGTAIAGAASETTWTVDDVQVSVGDTVTAGQLLATAASADIEAEITDLTTSIELARMKLAEAEQAVQDAKTDTKRALTDAKTAITAAELALKSAEINKDDAEDAGGEALRQAKIKLIQAQDKLRAAKQLRDDLEEQLDSGFPEQAIAVAEAEEVVAELEAQLLALDEQLELSRVTAPVAGIVTAVNLTPGFTAPSGSAIEMDSSTLEVIADVVESDVSSMALGQTAMVNIDALDVRVMGTVTSIVPTTDGDADSVVTFPVTVTLADPDPMVLSGMGTDVEITIAEAAGVVAVPAVALQGREANRTVQVLAADGSVEQRPVTVGLVNETLAEIQSGVLDGEEIIVGTVSERVDAAQGGTSVFGGSQVQGARALQSGSARPGRP